MTYKLGKNGNYILSEKAINHIINGDFSERQTKNAEGNTVLTKIISGGLHTFSAWNNFLSNRLDITHGLLVDSNQSEKWYYARKLQNGVILLKIPRDCFQSKAANITKFPETYYKSGYLWKTLFPIKFSPKNIISTIDEALNNINIEESNEALIIGCANPNDLFKSMKIRIQVRENEILSAFPTWEQPMTGNNGKPFSHIDSINTIISSSCIFANNDREKYLDNTIGKWNANTLDYYFKHTPDLIKNRKNPKKGKKRKKQLVQRGNELIQFGENSTKNEIEELYNLITTDEYLRHSLDFVRFYYNHSFNDIKKSLKIRNTISVFENLQEILIIINAWDLKNNRNFAVEIIHKLLKVRFIRTGGIDQWEIKRLSNLICEIISSYANSAITIDFLKALSKSPTRIGFYCEFNLNPYFIPNPALIGLTGNVELPLSENHFYDFVSQNLGINYTSNFNDDFNKELVRKLQIEEHLHGIRIVKDLIKFSVGSDFNYFSTSLIELVSLIKLDKNSINIIDSIIYDYHRCLASNIQRVLAKHKDLITRNLDFGDKDFIKYTKAKHEYKFLFFLNKLMIQEISKIYRENGFTEIGNQLEDKYLSLYEEVIKIPMPKGIPIYSKNDEKL